MSLQHGNHTASETKHKLGCVVDTHDHTGHMIHPAGVDRLETPYLAWIQAALWLYMLMSCITWCQTFQSAG